MKLLPLESAADIETASGWLAEKANYQWLDFGNGQQIVTPPVLKIMAQRKSHLLRLYAPDEHDRPVGIVGLENVNRKFRTATLWGAAGDKSFRSRGYSIEATYHLLTLAFDELGLHAVNTWIVEGNPSQRLVERLGFRYCGRQRESHELDGERRDRLLFDILADEHRARRMPTVRPRRSRRRAAQVPARRAKG